MEATVDLQSTAETASDAPAPTLGDAYRAALAAAQEQALASDAPMLRLVAGLPANHSAFLRRVFIGIDGVGDFAILPRAGCGGCDAKPTYRTHRGEPCQRPGCVGERIAVIVGMAGADKAMAEAVRQVAITEQAKRDAAAERPNGETA